MSATGGGYAIITGIGHNGSRQAQGSQQRNLSENQQSGQVGQAKNSERSGTQDYSSIRSQLSWVAPTQWRGTPHPYYNQTPNLNPDGTISFWRRMVHIRETRDDVFITIQGGVRFNEGQLGYAEQIIEDITTNLNGSYRFGSRKFHLHVNIFPQASRRRLLDFTFSANLNHAAQASVGGRLIQFGPRTRHGTFAHEFLHSLGLGHRPNWTGGIMSYAPFRSLQPSEVYSLYDQLRR